MEVCLECGQPVTITPKDRYRHIISNVAKAYGFTYQDMVGRCKTYQRVVARQHCYFALVNLGLSYSAVGRLMDRDHSTVMHGVEQHDYRMQRAEKRAKEQGNITAQLGPSAEGEERAQAVIAIEEEGGK